MGRRHASIKERVLALAVILKGKAMSELLIQFISGTAYLLNKLHGVHRDDTRMIKQCMNDWDWDFR